ncbi:mitochondrial elongation factor MEF2 [Lachancea thermotolerans CBS 6340]|uniref:Ribosome-releasing factor 2, mitochondrial n=1 Tax=Lachancea thermotolerans (strain ATCC 56472 / CBS 6340 / NRRL Y-8284) TaxID=559295 RepID=C5DG88_LACTC|nr:KLTH0D03256p [Lachancea thermotolerans CBS 6340]CAR22430.1 KLTH0D03256p [Lachancea thermotolerans CBS 6340]
MRLPRLKLWSQCRHIASRTDVTKLRNIGIIAHIDAGKTTTTERMLYFSGKTKRIGNVDEGDTVTDFLPQERSRGITIQSAAITFNWQNSFGINLIDTPGHADFTFEVIRSLKVLDGCVTILDAVAGVEAQTEKVWSQAKGIPKICFINKMDRVGAGFSRTVKELIVKMNTRVLLINIPVFSQPGPTMEPIFEGVLDVVNKTVLRWTATDVNLVNIEDVTSDSPHWNELVKLRESLIETLSEYDEDLVEYFLETANGDYMAIPAKKIDHSVRKCSLANFATPVLCGASFRNIGVQPLLDAVIKYLPSPVEARLPDFNHNLPVEVSNKKGVVVNKNHNLCVAQAFKVITDPIRGIMVYVRVYTGVLNSGFAIFNSTTGAKFKVGKLVIMHANVAEEVKQLNAGEIGVLTGSTVSENVRTGDTIIAHNMKRDGLRSLNKEKELSLKINPIITPPPVFSAAIEPRTLGNRKAMEESINALIREDPSLRVSVDEESGQTLLSGMGELHLEIAKDRLLNELNADVEVGKVVVSYNETLNVSSPLQEHKSEDGYHFGIQVEPLEVATETRNENEEWHYLSNDNNYLVMEKGAHRLKESNWPYQIPYDSIVNAILSSCLVAFQRGGKRARFPLHSCVVRVKSDWSIPPDLNSVTPILKISKSMILEGLDKIADRDYSILEPIMNITVTVKQQDMGQVLQDLTGACKANILSIEDEHDVSSEENFDLTFQKIAEEQYLPSDNTMDKANISSGSSINKIIKALVPVGEMVSYTSKLRSLTQGRGSYHMEYSGMEKVTGDRLPMILENY